MQPIVEPAVAAGEKDAVAPDDWRADAGALERHLPGHVVRGRPLHRELRLARDAVARRAAPGGPVVGADTRDHETDDRSHYCRNKFCTWAGFPIRPGEAGLEIRPTCRTSLPA